MPADGRIMDPDGNQQGELTWGYIRRFKGPDRQGKKMWPWKFLRKKVIPFLNKGEFKRGELVTFDVTKIEVKDPELGIGGLGIAINVQKYKQRK